MLRTLPLLVLPMALAQAPAPQLSLELRVFLGTEDVTSEVRISMHRAGERTAGMAEGQLREGRYTFSVPAGIYDAQIVREREGRVLNIRWAERLIVMPYPDEGGRHLEVVNFTNGYGALQIRPSRAGTLPETALFAAGDRSRPLSTQPADTGAGYALFVVPAGRYDLQIKTSPKSTWHTNFEVPLDRTRLWVLP
jgi:hypothetical protein